MSFPKKSRWFIINFPKKADRDNCTTGRGNLVRSGKNVFNKVKKWNGFKFFPILFINFAHVKI